MLLNVDHLENMNPLERYGSIIVGGLVVLILGAWNPRMFQTKRGERYSGLPSPVWLAIISVCVALLFQAFNPLEMMCGKI
jgi:hypothetical protein